MHKFFKKVLRGLVVSALAAAAAVYMCSAVSAEQIDLTETGDITVKFVSAATGEAITDGEFTLYQVALLSQEGEYLVYTYTGDFYYCSYDLSGSLDHSLAEALRDYALAVGAQGTTKSLDSDGTVSYENLALGLYLIVQTGASEGYYAAEPFLVSLPLYQSERWVYDITAEPKPESTDEPSETTTESSGGGGGEVTTEATETTTESSGGGGGTIEPDDPDDDDDPGSPGGGGGGNSYIIGEPDPTPSQTPSGRNSGSSDRGSDPGDPSSTTIPDDDKGDPPDNEPETGGVLGDEDEKEQLPQTGQNNLPVPVLSLSGLCLFSLGWKLYFTDGGENDAP